jgi:hypothetical protein
MLTKYFSILFLFAFVFTGKYLTTDFRYQSHPLDTIGYFPNQLNVEAAGVNYLDGTVKAYLRNGKIIYTDGRYLYFKFTDLY